MTRVTRVTEILVSLISDTFDADGPPLGSALFIDMATLVAMTAITKIAISG